MLVDAVREHAKDPDIPVWSCVANYYSVCVPSLIDSDAIRLWRIYCDLGGFQNETFASYSALPAAVMDAFHIIGGELNRITAVRTGNNGGTPRNRNYR